MTSSHWTPINSSDLCVNSSEHTQIHSGSSQCLGPSTSTSKFQPPAIDLLQTLSDLHNDQYQELSDLSTNLYNTAEVIRISAEQHQNASSQALQSLWQYRYTLDQANDRDGGVSNFKVAPDVTEERVQRLIMVQAETMNRSSCVRRALTKVLGTGNTNDQAETPTLSASLDVVYEKVAHKLSRWHLHRQMQSTTSPSNSSLTQRNYARSGSKESDNSALSQSRTRVAGSDHNSDTTAVSASNVLHEFSNPSHVPCYRDRDLSTLSTDIVVNVPPMRKSLHSDSDSDYEPPNTILNYFRSTKGYNISGRKTRKRKRADRNVEEQEEIFDNIDLSSNLNIHQTAEAHDTIGTDSASVLAAANRIYRIREEASCKKEIETMQRGEERFTGCE